MRELARLALTTSLGTELFAASRGATNAAHAVEEWNGHFALPLLGERAGVRADVDQFGCY